jgi:DNA polymerase III epsilon subunit family exonuclease
LFTGQRVVVVDIETTGWSATSDSIVEIGCVTIDGGATTDAWSSLVQPGRPMPADATRIHGITDAMLATAPAAAAVARPFRERLGDATIAIHNAPFDLPFLVALLRRHGADPLYNPVIDTLGLARGLFGQGGNSLTELTERHGIAHRNPHRALGDARATAELLLVLAPRWESQRGVLSLAELAAASQDAIRLTRKGGGRPPALGGAKLLEAS